MKEPQIRAAKFIAQEKITAWHNGYSVYNSYVLHETEIAILSKDGNTLKIQYGGWKTPTTARHIKDILAAASNAGFDTSGAVKWADQTFKRTPQ